MKYHVNADFEEQYFAPAPTEPKSVEWHDWPKVTALSGIVGWDALRSLAWNVYGPTNLEGGFLGFKHALETEDAYEDAKLLITSEGAIVGWATVNRDRRWQPATAVLDLFFHPNFTDAVPVLLSAVTFPDVKVQCYVDSGAREEGISFRGCGIYLRRPVQEPVSVSRAGLRCFGVRAGVILATLLQHDIHPVRDWRRNFIVFIVFIVTF